MHARRSSESEARPQTASAPGSRTPWASDESTGSYVSCEAEGKAQMRMVESSEAEKRKGSSSVEGGRETATAVTGPTWPRRVTTGSRSPRELRASMKSQ